MRPVVLLIAALPVLPGGCAQTPPLQARGNEPGWALTIADGTATYVGDYGARTRTVTLPRPETRGTTTTYRLSDPPLTIAIADRLCHDDMTGMPYPRTVTLDEGTRVLHGCGGSPWSLLAGDWQVSQIDGATITGPATLRITPDGKVAGRGPCSTFLGQVKLTGEGMTIGALAASPQACPPAQMPEDRRYLAALRQVTRFDIDPDGSLVLLSGDMPRLRARKP